MNRLGGLDLCDPCFHGGAARGAGARGWTLHGRSEVRLGMEQDVYHSIIEGSLCREIPLQARCVPKDLIARLMGPLLGLQTGDPLFDGVVHVRTTAGTVLRRLLEDDATRGAIMGLVGDGFDVVINSGRLSARYTSTKAPANDAHQEAALAVLMVHLDRFAAASG